MHNLLLLQSLSLYTATSATPRIATTCVDILVVTVTVTVTVTTVDVTIAIVIAIVRNIQRAANDSYPLRPRPRLEHRVLEIVVSNRIG